MRCGKCNFDNDQGRAFCASCGSELPVECRICGFGNEHAAKYCGGCGASIEQHWRPRVLDAPEIGSMSHETHSTSTAPLGLERRQLTVMFCDIVNSTGLAERVQPETLIKIFAAYRDLCAYAIEELGGTIANFMGDGVLIYFGYPKAQDDSVVQAVRGGRRIIERLKALNLRLELEYGEAIQLRIGIHTGLVIAGDFQGEQTRQGLAVFGNTPNIAARLQTLCEPNQVVVSETTHHLIEGLFRCELLGTRALKGVASPMAIYRVVEPTGVATRLEAAAARGLSPLIGRENELKMLLGAWSLAKQGKRQLVLVEGEPGIGKSRLIRALYDLVATEAHTRNHYACAPYYQNSALRPAINQFELALHIGDGDPNDLRLDKLERFLTELELPVDEIAPLFAALMGMVPGDRYPRLELDPKTRKTKTLEAAVAVAEASQRRQPMLLVVEDAHWIDPSTVELLTLVLDRLAEARLLMVVTYRPEFSPPWPDTDAVIRIVLNRLQDDEGKGLIVSMAEEQSLSPALVDAIRKRAEGIPLFLEELTRAVLESGLDDPGEALIPASLQDLLTARLDRLSTLGRDLVQTASVLGRVFPLDLLVRATSRATIDLEALMAELESANVVYRKATGKDVRYEFRHALIQEAAYGQMLRERRQDQHARIGEVLEAHFPDVANETPEIIAGHYTEAGAVAKAVPLWQQAGDRAARQSANLEAIAHYQKGLSLCAIMGDAKACDRSELALQYRLAGPLIATKGYTSPELGQTISRALEICTRIGETPSIFPVMYGRWAVLVAGGALPQSHELAEEFLRLAKQENRPELLMMGLRKLGQNAFLDGDYENARSLLRQSLALYDPQVHRDLTYEFGQEPGVPIHGWLSLAEWYLGNEPAAREHAEHCLSTARTINHANTLGYGYTVAGVVLHIVMGDRDAAIGLAETMLDSARQEQLFMWIATGSFLQGWTRANDQSLEISDREAAVAQMRQGADALKSQKLLLLQPFFCTYVGEALAQLGRTKEAQDVFAEGLAIAEKTGERWQLADLKRMQARYP